MKKLTIIVVLLVLASLSHGQFLPKKLGLEGSNGKFVSVNIGKIDTIDATYPLFIAPCNGYIAALPRMASRSGTAEADTTAARSWKIYFYSRDSVATAASDTIAYWTTQSTTGAYTQEALKAYKATAISANSSRIIHKRDVVSLRVDGTPLCAYLSDVIIDFVFVPTDRSDILPK